MRLLSWNSVLQDKAIVPGCLGSVRDLVFMWERQVGIYYSQHFVNKMIKRNAKPTLTTLCQTKGVSAIYSGCLASFQCFLSLSSEFIVNSLVWFGLVSLLVFFLIQFGLVYVQLDVVWFTFRKMALANLLTLLRN